MSRNNKILPSIRVENHPHDPLLLPVLTPRDNQVSKAKAKHSAPSSSPSSADYSLPPSLRNLPTLSLSPCLLCVSVGTQPWPILPRLTANYPHIYSLHIRLAPSAYRLSPHAPASVGLGNLPETVGWFNRALQVRAKQQASQARSHSLTPFFSILRSLHTQPPFYYSGERMTGPLPWRLLSSNRLGALILRADCADDQVPAFPSFPFTPSVPSPRHFTHTTTTIPSHPSLCQTHTTGPLPRNKRGGLQCHQQSLPFRSHTKCILPYPTRPERSRPCGIRLSTLTSATKGAQQRERAQKAQRSKPKRSLSYTIVRAYLSLLVAAQVAARR